MKFIRDVRDDPADMPPLTLNNLRRRPRFPVTLCWTYFVGIGATFYELRGHMTSGLWSRDAVGLCLVIGAVILVIGLPVVAAIDLVAHWRRLRWIDRISGQ